MIPSSQPSPGGEGDIERVSEYLRCIMPHLSKLQQRKCLQCRKYGEYPCFSKPGANTAQFPSKWLLTWFDFPNVDIAVASRFPVMSGRGHIHHCENGSLACPPDSASYIRATLESGFATLFMPISAHSRSPDAAPAESGKSRLNPATLIRQWSFFR